MKIAERVSSLPTYVLDAFSRQIRELESRGMDLIRMDHDTADYLPAAGLTGTSPNASEASEFHNYPDSYGIAELRQAIAGYYTRRFGINLHSDTEILPLASVEEGVRAIGMAFVEPGSTVLLPDPCAPLYRSVVQLCGGEVYPLLLSREKDFRVDFASIPQSALRRARVLWLNYPHNPTSACADLEFLGEAVQFARRHALLLIYANSAGGCNWSGERVPSILEVSGARDVALELNGISKTANYGSMAMVVGNAEAVAALTQLKSHWGDGIPRAFQEAAVEALNLPQSWHDARNAVYAKRYALVSRALERMRIWHTSYAASLYVWAEVAPGFSSADFCEALLETTGVAVLPGCAFGPQGEGYVRISLTQPEARLEVALERWERWLISKAMGLNYEQEFT